MKHKFLVLTATVMALSSCSQNTRTSNNSNAKRDSLTTKTIEQASPKALFATLRIKDSIKAGDSVKLKFTVYNPTDSVRQFCKWHTPFEPLMSKYLEIKDATGEEAAYQGPMAKRMMPPPASSYQKINPGDSLSIEVDLLKGYAIQKPAQYSISYTGQGMSGLAVKDSVIFVYAKP
jgi:hypothetical protein